MNSNSVSRRLFKKMISSNVGSTITITSSTLNSKNSPPRCAKQPRKMKISRISLKSRLLSEEMRLYALMLPLNSSLLTKKPLGDSLRSMKFQSRISSRVSYSLNWSLSKRLTLGLTKKTNNFAVIFAGN